MRPGKNEYFPYLETYISKVKKDTAVSALEKDLKNTLTILKNIPLEKWDFAYAPGKWTIKELVVHIMDVERIFAYRALCFARKEVKVLPSFDEDSYALNSEANSRSPESITEEFMNLRVSSISLFKGFSPEALQRSGNVPMGSITVNALAFTISGHTAHHMEVLKERYLK